jgi:hypothetical protein
MSTSTRSPWGLGRYALDPYGSAPYGFGISLVSAVPLSTNDIQVTTTIAPLTGSASQEGSALNPATWTVQRLDTLARFNVMLVTQDSQCVFILRVLEALGPASTTHQVSTSLLRDAGGGIIRPPRYADFLGLLDEDFVSTSKDLARRGSTPRDIANPQIPQELSGVLGGTLVVGANGDYELSSGAALLRKLILRRIMTTPGEFFHLPDYGVGLRVKEPIPIADLVLLKAEIERQVLRETEIESARVDLTTQPGNILVIQVRAKMHTTGEQVRVDIAASDVSVV